MTSRSLKFAFLSLGALAVFAGGYLAGVSRLGPAPSLAGLLRAEDGGQEAFQPLWEAYDLIHDEYYDQPVEDELLVDGALSGMLAALDDAPTRYLAPADEESARSSLEGNFEGIGAEVATDETGAIVIVAPYEGSPAAAAGLRLGDILRAADGAPLTGMDVGEAAALVRGPAGTTVRLLVERDGQSFEVVVTRDVIRIPSVRGEVLEDGIAYVRLSRFADNTDEELADLLQEVLAGRPVGLVLDLRGNPGGGLFTAVEVADQFLPAGVVLIERFGNGEEKLHEASDQGLAEEVPLVVLIDEGSASASEVLAGAIRDHDRGTLIGHTTFGKGTVQNWQPLSNGGGVRITIARWLTPDGDWVQDSGVAPDYTVGLPELAGEQAPPADLEDTQLDAAVDFLLGRPVIETPEPTATSIP
jgi:carboxyl-terminal processing protease